MLKPRPKNSATRRGRNGGMKPFFRATLKPGNVLELMVYEEIGESFDWSTYEICGITAKGIKSQIDSAGAYTSILMRINSPGGDVFEGVAILNILKSQGKPVAVKVDGIAASAASVIAMSGDTIEMGSGAMMMIHNSMGGCFGNAPDMAKMASALTAIDSSIAQTYVDRTGGEMDSIKAMMDAETWLTAEQCVEAGFATGLQKSTGDEQARGAIDMAKRFKAMARFTKVPEKLKPEASATGECECDCLACMDDDCGHCSNQDCTDKNCEGCPMQSGAGNKASPGVSARRERSAIADLIVQFRSHNAARWSDYELGGDKKEILALRRFGSAVLNLAPVADKSTTAARISGILAPYGAPSCDLGGFQEVYMPGCFMDSVAVDDPRILHNHNVDMILGRKSADTARFWDEADGFHYEVDLPDTQYARDLRVSMERGDVRESSAAFYITDHSWEQRDGIRTRVVKKARLLEGGPQGFAAYENSTAAISVEDQAKVAASIAANNELELIGARLQLLKRA